LWFLREYLFVGWKLISLSVIAGLDPAIHLLAKRMDPRVEPAGDDRDPRYGV
jgi:hypothetical protein